MPIAIVSIPVRDQGASLAFYRDVMRFDVLRDDPMGPDTRWIQLRPRDGGASITLVTWFDTMPPGSQQGLLIHVDDLDAEHARLSAAGHPPGEIRAEGWGRYAMLADPDGNRWVLATLTALA